MKVGRNDPCPCGSGKKYKKCCMRKENVVQLKEMKRDRFVRQKAMLQEELQDFLDSCVSFSERNRLKNEFKRRLNCKIEQGALDLFFKIWLSFFHVFENGKRGVEWFFERGQRRLDPMEKDMVEQWTTLRPSVIQVVDKNEEGLWVEDYDSKKRYFLPIVDTQTDLPPWSTTFCMIEEANDEYFTHGGAAWQGPEFLKPLSRKIDQLVSEIGAAQGQVVMDYFPEIFSVLLQDPYADWRKDKKTKEVAATTLYYHLHHKERVVEALFEHPRLIVDDWEDGEGSLGWVNHWYCYEDSENPDPVYLGHVNGTINVEGDALEFHTVNEEDIEMFQSWVERLSDAAVFEKKDVESMDVPSEVRLQTLRAHMSENTPPYFSAFAQVRFQQDLDQTIPIFGDRSPRALVQNGEKETVDLWLKEQEHNSFVQLRRQFDDPAHTDDFNTVRKALGLPLSPFVTGGDERWSSIKRCANPFQNANRVKQEDIPYYEALGITPDTKDEFFARDVVEFFKEKTIGKSKGTVHKYETSLNILVQYLLDDVPEVASWGECDASVWEQLLAYDYLASYDDVSINEARSLFSTLKALARWLDQKYELDLAAVVKPVVSKLETPVCDAIRFLDQFIPYHARANRMDAMRELTMILERVAYPDKQFVEGLFQVAAITANGIKVVDLENPGGKKYTVMLDPHVMGLVRKGMILGGTLSRPQVGGWEIADLEEVYPGEARDYLLN